MIITSPRRDYLQMAECGISLLVEWHENPLKTGIVDVILRVWGLQPLVARDRRGRPAPLCSNRLLPSLLTDANMPGHRLDIITEAEMRNEVYIRL